MNGLVKQQIKRLIRLWGLIAALLTVSCVGGLAANSVIVGNDIFVGTGSETVISDIRVIIKGPEEQWASYASMARGLIRLHPGDPFDEKALHASIEVLKLSNRFSRIHVDSATEKDGEALIFTLTPYFIIKDIRIDGKYPLFERDILNQMTIYPGEPYTKPDLSAQVGGIVKRYKREGYVNPKVSIKAERDTEDQQAIILVDIDKGAPHKLGTLTFQGNKYVSSSALKRRMGVWRSNLLPFVGRFSEYLLKKDIASLLTYYRSIGFADAELSYDLDNTSDPSKANVTVQIQEGPRYTVVFDGNRNFWDLTLDKDVVIFTKGNRYNIGVRRSIQNIKKRYHDAGFLDAVIKEEKTTSLGPLAETCQLRFVIEEGLKTIVNEVVITGDQDISETEIKKQILSHPPTMFHDGAFVPETLEADVYAINTLYTKHGFLERSVDSTVTFTGDKADADITLNITEGPRTTVRSIVIQGLSVVPEKKVRSLLALKVGDPFRSTLLEIEKETITSLVSEKGYPYALVQPIVSYSKDHTQADIVYKVDQGSQVTLGDIIVSGNLRTAEKIIRQELEVKPQSALSLQSLADGQRRLRDMGIFHGVNYRIYGLKEKAETVDLFVEVQENKPYYAQASLGYESDSGVFGSAKVGDRNLFGLNKDLWVSGKMSETGHRFETRLTEPRFFGTRIAATVGIFNEELTEFNQPFGTRTTGASLTFGHDWGRYIKTALSFSLENRDQFSVDNQDLETGDDESRTIFVSTPSIRYDSRDSFVRPTKGLLTSFSVDISKGIQNQVDDFVRYQFDTRYYWTPIKRVTFAGMGRVGQVISYTNSELVPDDQLFYLGGIQSVRGFDENLLRYDSEGNPVGGKVAMVGSLEARIDLGMNLELTPFFDIGSVQDAQVDGGSDRFRSSVGLGLSYISPIGPIGLLYGHKLDREEDESAGRFYFSIGYSF